MRTQHYTFECVCYDASIKYKQPMLIRVIASMVVANDLLLTITKQVKLTVKDLTSCLLASYSHYPYVFHTFSHGIKTYESIPCFSKNQSDKKLEKQHQKNSKSASISGAKKPKPVYCSV